MRNSNIRFAKVAGAYGTFLGLLFLAFSNASAFHVPPTSSTTSIPYRHSATALGVAERKPRWTELPRAREPRPELAGFEINTGRLAMLGFCGLLAREIVSGESFGEQLVRAVSAASGVNLPI